RRSPFQAATVTALGALLLAILAALSAQAQSARKESELQERQLAERERLDDLRSRFTTLYGSAELAAEEAARHPRGDRRADEGWSAVERDLSAALGLLEGVPELADFPLRPTALRLLDRAQGQLADASVWAEGRRRLSRLHGHHGDAVFFGS